MERQNIYFSIYTVVNITQNNYLTIFIFVIISVFLIANYTFVIERQSIYMFIYRDVFDSQNIYIYNNSFAVDSQYNYLATYNFVIDYQ